MEVLPQYIRTDAAGNGSTVLRAGRPYTAYRVAKVAVETPLTTAGTVTIDRDGQLLTSAALQPQIVARGDHLLRPAESLTVSLTGGPPNTDVKVTHHYTVETGPTFADGVTPLQFDATATRPPVDDPVVIFDPGFSIQIPGDGTSWVSDLFDVRAFNSYAIGYQLTPGTSQAFDPYQLHVMFYADQAARILMYEDVWETFPTPDRGPVRILDTLRGAFMQFDLSMPDAFNRDAFADLTLVGSYRQQNAMTCRGSADGCLLDDVPTVAAGAYVDLAASLGFGAAYLALSVPAGGQAKAELTFGDNLFPVTLVDTAADGYASASIALPKKQARVRVTNTGAASADIHVGLYLQPTTL